MLVEPQREWGGGCRRPAPGSVPGAPPPTSRASALLTRPWFFPALVTRTSWSLF